MSAPKKSKADRRRDAIYGPRATQEEHDEAHRGSRLKLVTMGFHEGTCSECERLHDVQDGVLVRAAKGGRYHIMLCPKHYGIVDL
jgi:hypothetical protein